MSKVDNLTKFLDENGPKVFDALKSTDKANFDRIMDQVMSDFLNLDLGPTKRKARTVKPKRRRGIGSY